MDRQKTIGKPADRRLQTEKNLNAFLWMIRFSVGTDQPDGYRVVYGYETVLKDLSDHPIATGEWTGKRLPDEYCRRAGINPPCKSTAAGAYQFIYPTWKSLKSRLNLKDFSPQSQDLAAIQLIRESYALEDVQVGMFSFAVLKIRHIWPSLPGNTAGQPQRKLAELKDYYINKGGKLA